jgi:signal transduction histidine kinase
MNTTIKRTLCALSLLALSGAALAGHTAADATALVRKAVVYLKKNGKEKLLAEASNPKGSLADGDLYLSVYTLEGKVVAHGANPKLLGVDVSQLRDANDRYFIKDILSTARAAGTGWVDYKWVDPASKTLRDKSVYLEKADDVVIAAGFYK